MKTLMEEKSTQQDETLNIPFPVEALPDPIRAFVEEGASTLPAPIPLFSIPALVAAGSAIGNTRHIRLKADWAESSCLYAAVVCVPGTMKSPALDKATYPIKKSGTWTSDTTVEALGKILQENARGVLLCRDELTGWVRGMNQYKEGKGSDLEFYLSTWGGQPYAFARMAKVGTIERPFLSIVGGIPPEVLPELDVSGGKADGFLPRILYAWPEAISVRWNENDISGAARDAYFTLFKHLYEIPYDPEKGPDNLGLSPEAYSIFTAWHDEHLKEMEDNPWSPFVQGAYAKLKGYCARFALIHAVCTDHRATEVRSESIVAGIELVKYFKAQAIKVDQLFDNATATDLDRCKAAIRRQLSVCRCLKKRDLQRKMNCKAATFNQALHDMSRAEIVIDDSHTVTWNW